MADRAAVRSGLSNSLLAFVDESPLERESLLAAAPDGLDQRREDVATLLDGLADRLTDLAPLDTELVFPLGREATAWRR
jgi:hypothetical protein